MKKILCLLLPCLIATAFAQTSVCHLLTENKPNPVGEEEQAPRFSWQLSATQRTTIQTAYDIEVWGAGNNKNTVGNSGKIMSDQSVYVPYKGKTPQSGKNYNWSVEVWDNYLTQPVTSEAGSFQMALIQNTDWKAQWIEPGQYQITVNKN